MKPTNELYDLVKSLTASEKRYFKLSTSMQKGNKNYLQLFDVIDSQKIYNEELIKRKYKKENFVRHLTFNKNYLTKLIFRSLSSYANEKSVESKLNNILNKCRFLFEKALFKQYFKTVEIGKRLARKYEMFGYHLEFLEIERQLTKKERLGKINMNALYDEELLVVEKIKNINNYKRTVSDLLRIYLHEGVVRSKTSDKKIDLILSDNKFKNEKQLLSLIAKERFYFALYLVYKIKGDAHKSFDYNKKRFSLISKNKKVFQKFIFDNYQESFVTLITSAAYAGKFDEAQNIIDKYNKIFFKPGVIDLDSLITCYDFKLLKLIIDEKNKYDDNLISSLEKFLIQYKGKLNIDVYNNVYYNLSRYFFSIGNFEEALRFINILFDSKYLKHTPNLEPYTRILNVLIHYEIGNYKLLSYLIPATTKYLKSKNKLFKTEITILNFFKKLVRTKDSQNIRRNFLALKKELEIIKKDKYEKNAFEYFDFLKWVNKKLIN